MSNRFDIGELRITEEITYMGSTTGTTVYPDLQDNIGIENLTENAIENKSIARSIGDAGSAPKMGLKVGNITVKLKLSGTSTAVTGASTADNFHNMLADSMGTGVLCAGDTVVTGSSTGVVLVSDATGILAKSFILVNNEASLISSVSGTSILIVPNLSALPVSGDVVYGSKSMYIDDTDRTTFMCDYHMEASAMGWRMQGMSFIPKFSGLGAGEGEAFVSLEAEVGDFSYINTDLGTPHAANLATQEGVVQQQGRFILSDGTNEISCYCSTFEPTLPIKISRYKNGCAQNSSGSPVLVREAGTIAFQVYQPETADPVDLMRNWFASGTALTCMYQVGYEPGDVLAFYFPRVYINKTPIPTDADGLVGIVGELKISANPTATLNSACYFGRL